ncbi:hypothetical protein C2G38_2032541 [Gigaspora rosea]|uniref:Uncharacterized protein n=1 Tax=Gigaspora rosea TaxID=44941 RepID=A0A397VMH9_9GLOM|nr:hypothetical protein C2G38_2032541 [Gigaspora rosea]
MKYFKKGYEKSKFLMMGKQDESHQRPWKEPCYASIVCPQHLKQQCPQIYQRRSEYHEKPKERVYSQAIPKKRCPSCQRKSHSILECPNVKRLDKRCNALFTALTSEQHDEFLEIINEKFPEALDDKQIPEALEFSVKVRPAKLSPKGEPIVAEILEPYSTSRIGTSGHVITAKSKNKEKAKPVDSLPKVFLGNEKQGKEKPKNSEQEVPMKRINGCQNDGNDWKSYNKKDTSDNCRITDDQEDPLDDIRNLYNRGCDYQNGIRIDNDEYEASEYNQALAPTSHNLFYCCQNEIEVEKIKLKPFVGYQRVENTVPNKETRDLGYPYRNGMRIKKNGCETFIKYRSPVEISWTNWNKEDGGKVTKSYNEKGKYQAFINDQKSAKMGPAEGTNDLGYSYQGGPNLKNSDFFDRSDNLGRRYGNGIGVEVIIFLGRTDNLGVCHQKKMDTITDGKATSEWDLKLAKNENQPKVINKERGLSNNYLQEMCGAWMDKVALIKDPPSLRKHANEVGDSIRMKKCKDNGNSPSFSNNKAENLKVKVELGIFLTMMKLHMMNDLERRADKDGIGDLYYFLSCISYFGIVVAWLGD